MSYYNNKVYGIFILLLLALSLCFSYLLYLDRDNKSDRFLQTAKKVAINEKIAYDYNEIDENLFTDTENTIFYAIRGVYLKIDNNKVYYTQDGITEKSFEHENTLGIACYQDSYSKYWIDVNDLYKNEREFYTKKMMQIQDLIESKNSAIPLESGKTQIIITILKETGESNIAVLGC